MMREKLEGWTSVSPNVGTDRNKEMFKKMESKHIRQKEKRVISVWR